MANFQGCNGDRWRTAAVEILVHFSSWEGMRRMLWLFVMSFSICASRMIFWIDADGMENGD